jgi:enoyl-CoA hydratase/carnithine racemase
VTYLEMDRIGTTRMLSFNSPPANGLNLELVEELEGAIAALRSEASDIRALVLASRVKNVFIAGADIKMIRRYMEGPDLVSHMVGFNTRLQAAINELEALPFPVIAAINGHAMGGGLEMVLACDFRFMADSGAKIGLPEVKLGLLPGAGGTQRLSRLIGTARAKRVIYDSLLLPAEEALRLGIVDRICPAASLMEECLSYANQFGERAAVAISVVKRCIDRGSRLLLEDGLRLEMEGLEELLHTSDAVEGVSAFVEKRQPRFVGR